MEDEKIMRKQNEQSKRFIKDKRFYTYTAFALTAAVLAIVVIITAAVIAKDNSVSVNNSVNNSSSGSSPSDSLDEPTEGVKFEDFLLPVEYVSVSSQFGFFYNQTLNSYYEHQGIDFMANEGEEVFAAQAGKVESIYTSDLLSGTQITLDHGNGVKSIYRFVEPKEGLEVGSEIKRGEQIGQVSQPTGDEYKDGAHLHFEVLAEGKNIDPSIYLTLAEK